MIRMLKTLFRHGKLPGCGKQSGLSPIAYTSGARRLLKQKRFWDIGCFLSRLHQQDTGLSPDQLNGIVPAEDAEAACQYYHQEIGTIALGLGSNGEILRFLSGDPGPFTVILPRTMRSWLSAQGMQLRSARSQWSFLRLQWQKAWLCAQMMRHILRRQGRMFRRPAPDGPYAAFVGGQTVFLPCKAVPPEDRWDMVSWYRRSGLIQRPLKEIWMVDVAPDDDRDPAGLAFPNKALPALQGDDEARAFLREASGIARRCLRLWLSGKGWAPFVCLQALELAYARHVSSNDFADQYLFNWTSSFMIRPLWTREAIRQGSRVVFVVYSHNFRFFFPDEPREEGQPGRTDPVPNPNLQLMTWPEYAVPEAGVEAALRQHEPAPALYHHVGAIGLFDMPMPLPETDRPAIAIFESEPGRLPLYARMGSLPLFGDIDYCIRFMEECCAAIRDVGAVPVWKSKSYWTNANQEPQNISAAFRRRHRVVEKYDAVIIDSRISSHRVASWAAGAIVMPFSSAATNARLLGQPVAYFDPSGRLAPFEAMAFGTPLILNPDDLRAWLGDIVARTGSSGHT